MKPTSSPAANHHALPRHRSPDPPRIPFAIAGKKASPRCKIRVHPPSVTSSSDPQTLSWAVDPIQTFLHFRCSPRGRPRGMGDPTCSERTSTRHQSASRCPWLERTEGKLRWFQIGCTL